MKRPLIVVAAVFLTTLNLVAAEVTGKWTYQVHPGAYTVWGKTTTTGQNAVTIVIMLKANGSVVTGTVTSPGTRVPNVKQIYHGKTDGDTVSFDTLAMIGGVQLLTHYAGRINGDSIHFLVKTGGGGGAGTPIDATRATD